MTANAAVPGERTVARVAGSRSYAVRAQQALAAGLVLALGVAVLTWYYVRLGDDAARRATGGGAALRNAAASEMRLPALEPPPMTVPPAHDQPSADVATGNVEQTPAAQGRAAPRAEPRPPAAYAAPVTIAAPALRETAPVLLRSSSTAIASSAVLPAIPSESSAAEAADTGSRVQSAATLGGALQPTVARPAEAGLLSSRRWLLPKGSFLGCTLETAIDSTFAGLTTCILATDVFGADGRVVLMERGTKLIGETRSDVRLGQARVAVLWDEARTPAGVVLNLASPGTDALGRAGVPGAVDRHTAERFGAAFLLSMVDVGVAALASHGQGSGVVVYSAQESRDVATEVLRNTMTIPPTIRVAPGARLTVTVVRDIDFRSVYRLAPHGDR